RERGGHAGAGESGRARDEDVVAALVGEGEPVRARRAVNPEEADARRRGKWRRPLLVEPEVCRVDPSGHVELADDENFAVDARARRDSGRERDVAPVFGPGPVAA